MQYEKPRSYRMDSWKREGRLLSRRAAAIEKELYTSLLCTKTGLLEAAQLEQELNTSTERSKEVAVNEMIFKLSEVKVGDERGVK